MDLTSLEQLLQLMRRHGVLRLKNGEVDVLLGPAPAVVGDEPEAAPEKEEVDEATGLTRAQAELLFHSSGG